MPVKTYIIPADRVRHVKELDVEEIVTKKIERKLICLSVQRNDSTVNAGRGGSHQ